MIIMHFKLGGFNEIEPHEQQNKKRKVLLI